MEVMTLIPAMMELVCSNETLESSEKLEARLGCDARQAGESYDNTLERMHKELDSDNPIVELYRQMLLLYHELDVVVTEQHPEEGFPLVFVGAGPMADIHEGVHALTEFGHAARLSEGIAIGLDAGAACFLPWSIAL